MGNYLFTTDVLVDALRKDAADAESRHDMGGDIVPMMVGQRRRAGVQLPGQRGARRHRTRRRVLARRRDPGLLLRRAHGSVRRPPGLQPLQRPVADPHPGPSQPPAKFVHDDGDGRIGRAINSMVSNGVIVSGSLVRESVLSPGVRVENWATVERSVVMHNTRIGPHAVVRNAILDKNVIVPEGAQVGVDKEHDRARGFAVSDGGVTVVGKGQLVTP